MIESGEECGGRDKRDGSKEKDENAGPEVIVSAV